MSYVRSVVGFSAAALSALVALAPIPAAAGPVVLTTSLVRADVELFPPSIAQSTASGTASLSLTGAANSNLSLTIKATGLPASTPAACAVLCAVDGAPDLFDFVKFKPCGTTTAGGKLTFTGTVPFTMGEFDGGCLLPVPAVWIRPEEPPMEAAAPAPANPLVVCAPGFGTFESFDPFPPSLDCPLS